MSRRPTMACSRRSSKARTCSRQPVMLARSLWLSRPRTTGGRSVTDSHVTRLVRRVVQEHRRAVVIIAAAFVVNVLLYVFVVRPLNQSVATVEQRTVAAEQAKAAAQAEFDRANGTLSGKARATKELDTFYSMVLAQDLSGARRLTYG